MNHRLVDAAAALGVDDERVLQAMREVPRSLFVPSEYRAVADLNRPVPIGHGQVTTQPSRTEKSERQRARQATIKNVPAARVSRSPLDHAGGAQASHDPGEARPLARTDHLADVLVGVRGLLGQELGTGPPPP